MAIEAAGRAITRRQSLATLKPGGTAVFIGLGTEDAETSLPCLDVVNRELRIIGSYAYSDFEFLHAMDLLRREIIQQVGWVSKIPMIQGPKAFEELVQGKSRAAKIVLLP
jgi:threonine dehydrogenase-like Zn-dependent dehydrogenase